MSSSCYQRLATIFVLLAITMPAFQLAWQGTGDMNETVMAEIRSGINSGKSLSISTANQFGELAQNISTRLNNLWDPAWNVVIVMSVSTLDTIVYGYAFKNHWMWINGISFPSFPSLGVSYIIWKDYNCQRWARLSELITTTDFSIGQMTQIAAYKFSKVNTDVWLETYDFVNYLNNQSLLSSGAYTVVMTQASDAEFYGYVCLVNNYYVLKKAAQNVAGGAYGSYFLFRTR